MQGQKPPSRGEVFKDGGNPPDGEEAADPGKKA